MTKDPRDNNLPPLMQGGGHSFPQKQWRDALVGDVRVEAVLSESATALVLLGKQEGVGRPAVVKLLPFSGDVRGSAERRILKNAQVLSQLRHANIVTLYDVGLFESRYPYLVMEYISGGTLKGVAEAEAPLQPVEALGMLRQIAHALEDVHRIGLTHQNLTLDNVLVESLAGSGHNLIKLTNFGLSSGPNPTHTDASSGSAKTHRALLMTPEEGLGEEFGAKGDIYLCGLLLYELLTGRKPYRVLTLPELWDEIVSRRPMPLLEASPGLALYPELQMLIDQMLAKNPSSRPTSARALRLMLGQVIEDIEQKDAAVAERRGSSFPVLNTVERIPAIPRPSSLPPAARRAPRIPVTPQEIEPKPTAGPPDLGPVPPIVNNNDDTVPFQGEPQQAPPSRHKAQTIDDQSATEELKELPLPRTAREARDKGARETKPFNLGKLDIERVVWSSPRSVDLLEAADRPYIVLVVIKPSGQVPPGLSDKVELLLGATLNASMVMMTFKPPQRYEGWLSWLSARARQFQLKMGFAFGRRFDAVGGLPASYTVRMAIQAVQRAEVEEIVAARHAVDALTLTRIFSPVDNRLAGRYASFMKYTGLKGSD